MTNDASAIEARELVKRFEDIRAVDGITFAVGRGELFGFPGPNGAVKENGEVSGLCDADLFSVLT